MPNEATCRTCVWWNTDARRATISAPCRITTLIRRPGESCAQHAPHAGPRALDPLSARLTR